MIALRNLALISAVSILAVWIAYPLIIAALSRCCRVTRPADRATEPAATAHATTVSVVIATRDEPSLIRERVLDCLREAEEIAGLEVVVGIDARATPVTLAELSIAPNVVVVPGDAPGGKATALNAAVRAASGDVLLFTDVHQRFEPHAVARLLAAFDDPHVGAASGRLELGTQARRSLVGRYWSYERWLRRCEAGIHSCVGATGGIWALRRSLWAPLPPTLINDDLYGPMRVVLGGHRVVFADDARAMDVRHVESGSEYHRKVRTLTGIIQMCAWLPQVLVPRRNPIWMQFVTHKLLRLLTPYWLIAILLWCSVTIFRVVAQYPAAAAGAAVAVVLLALVGRPRAFGLLHRSARSWLTLQAAVVVATVNGCRRRWDVWHA